MHPPCYTVALDDKVTKRAWKRVAPAIQQPRHVASGGGQREDGLGHFARALGCPSPSARALRGPCSPTGTSRGRYRRSAARPTWTPLWCTKTSRSGAAVSRRATCGAASRTWKGTPTTKCSARACGCGTTGSKSTSTCGCTVRGDLRYKDKPEDTPCEEYITIQGGANWTRSAG